MIITCRCQQWVLTTAASTAKTESSRWDMPLAQIMATARVGANETDKTQRSKRERVETDNNNSLKERNVEAPRYLTTYLSKIVN